MTIHRSLGHVKECLKYMANSNNYNVLFLPGLPGDRKKYDIFVDVERSGGSITWLTYTGTYERSDFGAFSLQSCVVDIENGLLAMEEAGNPYLVVAYSFSSAALRLIDFSSYNLCAGVLLYSPIVGLEYAGSHGNFSSLLDYLQDSGVVNSLGDWSAYSEQPSLHQWLTHMNAHCIPTAVFVGADDETRLPEDMIQTIAKDISENAPYIQLIEVPTASHKINSYHSTVARWYLWAFITKILLGQTLTGNHAYYLWGSMLSHATWTAHSDIDILIIGDISSSDYGAIAALAEQIEDLSGIHLGMSINSPTDLCRDQYIRRNRGAVFLRELKTHAMPLGGAIAVREVSDNEVIVDALNTNRILRAEIAKQLLGYHRQKPVAKSIVKSYIQAVRLAQYAKHGKASYDIALAQDGETGQLLRRCIEAKHNNYATLGFDDLYALHVSIDQLIKEQERTL